MPKAIFWCPSRPPKPKQSSDLPVVLEDIFNIYLNLKSNYKDAFFCILFIGPIRNKDPLWVWPQLKKKHHIKIKKKLRRCVMTLNLEYFPMKWHSCLKKKRKPGLRWSWIISKTISKNLTPLTLPMLAEDVSVLVGTVERLIALQKLNCEKFEKKYLFLQGDLSFYTHTFLTS